MTAGDHFERVAAVYESLRTTDEAPVRWIRQLLPDRPVTGLDIGCGTGRYSRLLRALLPDGSLLAASDVSAAMLAQLKAANRGHAFGVVPLLAAAEELPLRAASLDLVTAFNCVHHFDLGRFLTAAARVLAPERPAVHLHPHPAAERANDLGPLLPGLHRARAAPAQPGRDPGRRQAHRRAAGGRNPDLPASAHQHSRAAPGPRPRGATTRRSPSTRRRSCARPSRRSWPACPAPRSPGLTSTSWSSSAGAAATRWSLTVRAAWRAGRSRIRPSRSAPGAPVRLPTGVLAAARRPAPHRRQAPASAPASPPAQVRPAAWAASSGVSQDRRRAARLVNALMLATCRPIASSSNSGKNR